MNDTGIGFPETGTVLLPEQQTQYQRRIWAGVVRLNGVSRLEECSSYWWRSLVGGWIRSWVAAFLVKATLSKYTGFISASLLQQKYFANISTPIPHAPLLQDYQERIEGKCSSRADCDLQWFRYFSIYCWIYQRKQFVDVCLRVLPLSLVIEQAITLSLKASP